MQMTENLKRFSRYFSHSGGMFGFNVGDTELDFVSKSQLNLPYTDLKYEQFRVQGDQINKIYQEKQEPETSNEGIKRV